MIVEKIKIDSATFLVDIMCDHKIAKGVIEASFLLVKNRVRNFDNNEILGMLCKIERPIKIKVEIEKGEFRFYEISFSSKCEKKENQI